MGYGKIAIFFTGGTIAMRQSADGTVRPALHLKDLLADLFPSMNNGDCVGAGCELEAVEWADLPSPHMTPALMWKLAQDVKKTLHRPEIIGAVVTHGTDVLEETAFMLDLLLPRDKPVIITGSMRSYGEAGYDGLRNLGLAIQVCTKEQVQGFGVLALMTDKLFAAREVTKVHSLGVDSFDAPGIGPVGYCAAGGIQVFRKPVVLTALEPQNVETRVDLVALAPGMGGHFIACAREHGAKGLVVEGFGAGNIPPDAVAEIEKTLSAGIPVVLTSRCIEGGVWPVYGYSGGANSLQNLGVILGGNLRAQKARILLMLALALEKEGKAKIKDIFSHFLG